MILLLTNYSLGLSLYLFPIRLLLELISSMNNLFRFQFSHFFAHYAAILYIIFHINFIYDKRKKINKIRIITDKDIFNQNIILNESIVKKYFLFRNKTYNEYK